MISFGLISLVAVLAIGCLEVEGVLVFALEFEEEGEMGLLGDRVRLRDWPLVYCLRIILSLEDYALG